MVWMDNIKLGMLKHKLNSNIIVSVYENGNDILALEFDDGDIFEVYPAGKDELKINNPLGD